MPVELVHCFCPGLCDGILPACDGECVSAILEQGELEVERVLPFVVFADFIYYEDFG